MDNQEQSGRSMIEMLGVLGIMGVIMYGAVVGINFGIEMYKVNIVHSEVEELSRAVIDFGSFVDGYSFLSSASDSLFCKNAAFPCDPHTMHMQNKWGGNVTVEPSDCATVGSGRVCRSFVIKYTNVPKVPCKRLIDDMWFERVCISSPKSSDKCGSTNQLVFSVNMNDCKGEDAD